MSEPLFWLVKGEERHAVHVRDDGLAVPSRVWPWVWSPRHERVVFPGGAEARPAVMPTTTDEAAALIRALALPVGGYEVRERGMAGAWTGRPRRCYDVEDGRWIASEVADDGWRCWLDYGGGEESDDGDAHGPETGDAGKAAADAWLTAHAPWVTLEGGAFVLPPAEPVDPLAVFDDVVEAERAAAQRIAADRGRAGVEAMAQVVGVQALTVRLEALDARVAALEAVHAKPSADASARDPRVDPRPGDVLLTSLGEIISVWAIDGCAVFAHVTTPGERDAQPSAIGRDVWPSVRRDHRVLWVSP